MLLPHLTGHGVKCCSRARFFFYSNCNLLVILKSHGEMPDAELGERVLSGNEQACRFLVTSYQRLVNHIVRRMVLQDAVAEDLCQDVFLRVFRRLHTFRRESRLSTWIATIAYNTTATYLKKRKLMNERELDHFEPSILQETGFPVADGVDREEVRQLLLRTIEALPVHYRTVVTLYYLDEFSCNEIGEITGMPGATIRNYLHRARQLLKSKLENRVDYEERAIISS